MIDFRELVKAQVHFGHQASRWVPRMKEYIWGVKNKIHLIDVAKTAYQLEKAAQFLESITAQGKLTLWVGTKRAAKNIIEETGKKLEQPFVADRWIGGTCTNPQEIKKAVTKMLHFEDVLAKAEDHPHYTKKELNEMRKNVDRLRTSVGGITNLKWPLGALIVVDVNKERTAIKEAAKMGIPIVAIVDTNADPSLVDYVIPANDDASRSIKIIIDYLAQAVERGKESAKKATEKAKAEKLAKEAEEKAKAEETRRKVAAAKATVSQEKSAEKPVEKKQAAQEKKEESKVAVKTDEAKKEVKPVAKNNQADIEKPKATQKEKNTDK